MSAPLRHADVTAMDAANGASCLSGGTPQPSCVLFIVPSLSRAGAETQVLDLLDTLDTGRWRAILVTFEAAQDQRDRLARMPVLHVHIPRRRRFDASLVREVSRIIDAESVRIVHATLNISVLLGWAAARLSRSRPRVIAALHTTVNRSMRFDLADALVYRPVLSRCDHLIFVSHRQRDHWRPRLSSRSRTVPATVIHNGIDLARYAPGIVPPGAWGAGGRPIVACIAALRPEKGHAILLDAWSRVVDACPEATLVIAGSGPEEAALRERIQRLGLSHNVIMAGKHGDVRPLLETADLTVLPSVAVETLSLAVLESMAMAVPVVATRVGGIAEAVEDGETGLLVPPRCVSSLANALVTLLRDPARRQRMSQAGRRRAVEHFDRQRMARETDRVLQETLLHGQSG